MRTIVVIIYRDTSTYHGKEYMKLQNGSNFFNSRMPQFDVCFNHLRKYFFCLCMEYLISKNGGYWILKYSSWLFRISQLYTEIWSTDKILPNIDVFFRTVWNNSRSQWRGSQHYNVGTELVRVIEVLIFNYTI